MLLRSNSLEFFVLQLYRTVLHALMKNGLGDGAQTHLLLSMKFTVSKYEEMELTKSLL